MARVKHNTTVTVPNNPSKQVSANAWNDDHAIIGTPSTVLGFDGAGASVDFPATALGTGIVGAADAAAARVILGLGSAATAATTDFLASGDGDRGDVSINGGIWSVDADAPNIVNKAQQAATRSTLASLPTASPVAFLREASREGTFVFVSTNCATQVAIDTLQGIYVAPTSDPTGASGAWVRKFSGYPSVMWFGAKGDGTTDDTTPVNTAITIVGSLALNSLKFDGGRTFLMTTQTTFGVSNLEVEGYGATIKNTFDGRAFAFSGSNVRVRGLNLYQAATGADPAPYAEVTGANVTIEQSVFTRDATAHIPFYVRSTATGFRFRNNRCTWYGGINLISDVVDFQIVGNSFIGLGGASDDGIAIKATGTGSRRGLIAFNYFENMADFVGIGSEIGVLGTTDSTYSHEVSGIIIVGNDGKNCARMVMIKPGGVDGVDYRDGTVRGVTISNNTLIDENGTALLNGILIQPGRGARVIGVTGRNNKIIGRFMLGGANLHGKMIYLRNDGTGTADVFVDKIDVGIEILDPFNGAANGALVNGVAAPGAPCSNFVHLEKQNSANGTATNVVIDVIGNGCNTSGVRVTAGFDNGVFVRRAQLTNVDTNGSSSFGGIHSDSIITVGSEISMTMAAGSSGLQYVTGGSGAVLPVLPEQVAASSLLGNATGGKATATTIGLAGGLGFAAGNLTINGTLTGIPAFTISGANLATSTITNSSGAPQDLPLLSLSRTSNESSPTITGSAFTIVDHASNYSFNIKNGAGTSRFSVGPNGNTTLAGSLTIGSNAVFNNIGILQGTAFPTLTGDVSTTNGSLAATVNGAPSATTALTTTSANGVGYRTGAGGAVTQVTSRTTGVTLNKPTGAITLVSAAGSSTWSTFTVTNSTVAATDTVVIAQKSGANLYNCIITAVNAGSFNVSVSAVSGTATESPVLNFAVIKAVAA